jgi:hypothetical protein
MTNRGLWRLVKFWLLLGVAASCSANSGEGSESHFFVCRTDLDCDGGSCVAYRCTADVRTPDGAAITPPLDASTDAPPDGFDARLPDAHVEQPANCVLASTSTIPQVHVDFTTPTCAFSLAQARAGIHFPYRIVIDEDVPGYTSNYQNAEGVLMYLGGSIAGLRIALVLSGGAQHYCLCDQGGPPAFCDLDDGGSSFKGAPVTCNPITLRKGTYDESWPRASGGPELAWDGRNWNGPSDTPTPEGNPFPAGDYTLELRIDGQIVEDAGTKAVGVDVKFLVRLVP